MYMMDVNMMDMMVIGYQIIMCYKISREERKSKMNYKFASIPHCSLSI